MEALKGVSEKLIPMVRSPLLMRTLLPGVAATAVIYPCLRIDVVFSSEKIENLYRPAIGISLLILLLGLLLSFVSNDIYRIYEGRIFWPQKIFDALLHLQQARVKMLRNAAAKAEDEKPLKYREFWYLLRRYPTDENGDPCASHPTLLGNIIAAYEGYPLSRYGMDGVFYWTRIWLQMEREKKDEIESVWCVADGLVTLSAVGYGGALFWLTIGIARALGLAIVLNVPYHPFLITTGLLTLGYLFYRLSLPCTRANGEVFKAVFDLYRNQLMVMAEIGPVETERWRGVWSYLQYLLVHCASCGKYYAAKGNQCPSCGFPKARSLSQISRSR